jgi:hypothetical protein
MKYKFVICLKQNEVTEHILNFMNVRKHKGACRTMNFLVEHSNSEAYI